MPRTGLRAPRGGPTRSPESSAPARALTGAIPVEGEALQPIEPGSIAEQAARNFVEDSYNCAAVRTMSRDLHQGFEVAFGSAHDHEAAARSAA